MSVLEGLGAAVVLLVVAAATWMNYVALGHMLKDFRKRWPKLPAKRKRILAITIMVTVLVCGASVALVIVQPWAHGRSSTCSALLASLRSSVVSAAPLALHPKTSGGLASGGT